MKNSSHAHTHTLIGARGFPSRVILSLSALGPGSGPFPGLFIARRASRAACGWSWRTCNHTNYECFNLKNVLGWAKVYFWVIFFENIRWSHYRTHKKWFVGDLFSKMSAEATTELVHLLVFVFLRNIRWSNYWTNKNVFCVGVFCCCCFQKYPMNKLRNS